MKHLFSRIALVGFMSGLPCGMAQAQLLGGSDFPVRGDSGGLNWQEIPRTKPVAQGVFGASDFNRIPSQPARAGQSKSFREGPEPVGRDSTTPWDSSFNQLGAAQGTSQVSAVVQNIDWGNAIEGPVVASAPAVIVRSESQGWNDASLADPLSFAGAVDAIPHPDTAVDQVALDRHDFAETARSSLQPAVFNPADSTRVTPSAESISRQTPSVESQHDLSVVSNEIGVEPAAQLSLIPFGNLPMDGVMESGPRVIASNSSRLEVEGVTLRSLLEESRGDQSLPETIIPVDIIPFNRLTSLRSQISASGSRLDVSTMTGPLANSGALFDDLQIENDFRLQASLSMSDVRRSSGYADLQNGWMHQDYAWVTPAFFHQPLYFEQPNLERYGMGARRWLQPAHSAAHFFGSVGLLPYKLITQHPRERVYTLGNNRPGDCVPYQRKTLLGQSYPFEAMRYFDDYSGYR